jgi:hypothetical protein
MSRATRELVLFAALLVPWREEAPLQRRTLVLRGTMTPALEVPKERPDVDDVANLAPRIEVQVPHGQGGAYWSDYCVRARGAGEICTAKISPDAKDLRIVMSFPGYRSYSRNVPKAALRARGDTLWAELGPIRLEESTLPRVEPIILTRTPDEFMSFELPLRNPAKRSVYVSSVAVELYSLNRRTCCCTP